jgi:hypothetical protein
MNNIPSEIITTIGSYLPFRSLVKAKQVNKEWNESLDELSNTSYETIPWSIGIYYVNSGMESNIYNAFICIGYPSNINYLCHKYTPLGGIEDLQLVFLNGRGGKLLQEESLHFDINMIHSTITLVTDKTGGKKRKPFARRFHIDMERVIGDLDYTQDINIPVSKDWVQEDLINSNDKVYSYCPIIDEYSSEEDIFSDDSCLSESYSDDEMDCYSDDGII